MISPSDWKQQAIKQQQGTLPWLALDAACSAFAASELPTRKTERWKYTPVTALLQQDYLVRRADASVDPTCARSRFVAMENACRIVFVNGVLNRELSDFSDLENQGVVTRFSMANEEQQKLIRQHLGSAYSAEQHLFASMNHCGLNDGLLIHAPAMQKLSQSLYLVYLGTQQKAPAWAQSRVLLVAEPGAELKLVEQFDSCDAQANLFHNHVTEVIMQPNARLQHIRVQVEDEGLVHINGLHIRQARDSHYEQHSIAFGSALKRNDVNVTFDGENAHCEMNGVFLSKHRQHIDNHLNLEHAKPHCTSNTNFKGFVTGESRAVFNGRIHIHQHAQKTEAHLNNKNLLLSKQAELNTKPELEIYADDVKCSHGASIGQLDDKSMFYFQSRGIDRASAEAMLCLGFVNEKVEQIPSPAIQALVGDRLAAFFNDVDKFKSLWGL